MSFTVQGIKFIETWQREPVFTLCSATRRCPKYCGVIENNWPSSPQYCGERAIIYKIKPSAHGAPTRIRGFCESHICYAEEIDGGSLTQTGLCEMLIAYQTMTEVMRE